MNAYLISTRAAPQLATVWADSAAHAHHVARHVLKVARGNAWLSARQIDGRPNRFPIERRADEAPFGVEGVPYQRPPAPPRSFDIEPITFRLLLDGLDTGLRVSQRGGSVSVYEAYETDSWGCDAHDRPADVHVTGFELPRKRYTLDTWPAKPRTGSYLDFERDVRALINSLDNEGRAP